MLTLELVRQKELPLYQQIYEAIKKDILSGVLEPREKLPSKRKLAAELRVSQTTVETAYSQLKAEGYIYSQAKSGYYVERLLTSFPDHEPVQAPIAQEVKTRKYRYDFQTGGVITACFPFSTWAKLTRETLSEDKDKLLSATPSKGLYELRREICQLLRRSRGVEVQPEQVIVGAGWEYLLGLIIQILGRHKVYGIEDPGYPKASLILGKLAEQQVYLPVDAEGVSLNHLGGFGPEVIHVTPSHHFPLGIVTSARRRGELLRWAEQGEGRYIIEDDYDSEFRLYGRPIPSIYGLDRGEHVIYIKTFTRSLAPSLRLAYMVLPPSLLKIYDEELYFYTSTVPRLEQHVLARFLNGGYLERHLNRVRNIYRKNRKAFLAVIKGSSLAERITVFRDDGGSHLLLQVQGFSEEELVKKASQAGINILGISSYYKGEIPPRYRNAVVVGYSGFTEAELPLAAAELLKAWGQG